ncbi:hypothetical protein JW835_13555 [bacterium]|nr:hypothetical protein [bacterium]
MRLKIFIVTTALLGIVLCFQYCEVRNPADERYFYPEIDNITTPRTVALQGDMLYSIYVTVSDPQGLEDIAYVQFSLSDSLEDFNLHDNGHDGDLIPKDGSYSGRFLPELFSGKQGAYQLQITAQDHEGNMTMAFSDTIWVEDTVPDQAPVLHHPVVSDTVAVEELTNFYLSIHAYDGQGLDDIDSLVYQIYPPLSTKPIYQSILRDDGTGGDIAAGDSVFSICADLSDTLKGLGPHQIRFQAKDIHGNQSVPLVVTFFIAGINDEPILSNLNAPVVINRLDPTPIVITIQVTDPQGPADVRKVYFNSIKPNGFPARGNPFILRDDGSEDWGDEKAGDGIYSIAIVISSDNQLGRYTFSFYAQDLAGDLSEPRVHYLVVMEEELN